MDKAKCIAIRELLNKALVDVGASLGVKISVGHASYTSDNAMFKVEAADVVAGLAVTKEVSDFRFMAGAFGLKPDDLGKKVFIARSGDRAAGTEYEICGLKPASTRFPILAKRVRDGTVFKLPAETVRAALGRKRPESEILKELRQVDCELSSENLTGNGELSSHVVASRSAGLRRRQTQLVAELGRAPTTKELSWEGNADAHPR